VLDLNAPAQEPMSSKSQISIESLNNCIEFVEEFLEPQFVDLMDDNEEHLIVLMWLREEMLE